MVDPGQCECLAFVQHAVFSTADAVVFFAEGWRAAADPAGLAGAGLTRRIASGDPVNFSGMDAASNLFSALYGSVRELFPWKIWQAAGPERPANSAPGKE